MLIKNDDSPAMYPLLHPYGSLVYQAGRGDVHTVLVNGQVVKHEHKLVGVDLRPPRTRSPHRRIRPVDDGRRGLGRGMKPELPTAERIPNPYTYTSYSGSDDRHAPQA